MIPNDLARAEMTVEMACLIAILRKLNWPDPPYQGESNISTELIAQALVNQVAEQSPKALKAPGAALATLSKLGIAATAKLADGRHLKLGGPEDLQPFTEALVQAPRPGGEGGTVTVCFRILDEEVCVVVFKPWL